MNLVLKWDVIICSHKNGRVLFGPGYQKAEPTAGLKMGKRIFLLALVFFLSSALLSAQDENNFQEQIKVSEHLTDVVVKDSDGNFVRGLKKSDFNVFIDGKEVEVKFLKEFTRLLPSDPVVQKYIKDMETAREQKAELPAPPTEPRNIIIVFDRYNMSLNTLRKSKANAKKMLNEMVLPYDRVAVFEYNKSLRHLAGPTSNREKLFKAIDAVSSFSHNHYLVPDPLMFQKGATGPGGNGRLIQAHLDYDFMRYKHALTQVANAVSFLPGKKNFLVYSDGPDKPAGFEESELASLSSTSDLSTPGDFSSGSNNMQGSPVAEVANQSNMALRLDSSNSTFYFIRRGSLQPAWMLGVDGSLGSPDKETLLRSTFSAAAHDLFHNRIENMWLLALRTKGKVYTAGVTDENLFKGLSSEVGDFYTMSFSVPKLKPGKFYSLEVKPRNKDYHVVARSGFFGSRPFSELSQREKRLSLETSLLGSSGVNQLGLETNMNLVPSAENSYVYYSFMMPVNRLGISRKGKYILEQIICVHDHDGTLRFRTHKVYSAYKADISNVLLTFMDYIPVLPSGSRISTIVRDNVTGRISVTHRSIKTVKTGESLLNLAEPVFLSQVSGEKLEEWQAEEIKDNAGIKQPLQCAAVALNGIPMDSDNIVQGNSVLLNVQVTDLPDSFDPSKGRLFVEFSYSDGDNRYILVQKDQRVQLHKSGRALIYTADIPLGMLPHASGDLEVLVKGLDGDKFMITTVPFMIRDFSQARAEHYKNNSRIILDVN